MQTDGLIYCRDKDGCILDDWEEVLRLKYQNSLSMPQDEVREIGGETEQAVFHGSHLRFFFFWLIDLRS